MLDPLYVDVALGGAATATLLAAAYQVLSGTLKGGGSPRADSSAFRALSEALKRVDPTLPDGFTLREAMARLIAAGVRADWDRFAEELERYEGQRYGGEAATGNYVEVARVARAVWRMV